MSAKSLITRFVSDLPKILFCLRVHKANKTHLYTPASGIPIQEVQCILFNNSNNLLTFFAFFEYEIHKFLMHRVVWSMLRGVSYCKGMGSSPFCGRFSSQAYEKLTIRYFYSKISVHIYYCLQCFKNNILFQ